MGRDGGRESGDNREAMLMSARPGDPRLVRHPSFRRRMLSAPFRTLPDFVVIGAMKSGTSSLFNSLCQHPSIAPPWRKETHFFTAGLRAGRSLRWYRAHFPLGAAKQGRLTGEATPDYVFESHVPFLLGQTVPRAKLVLVLRDPVERAISQYFHEVRMGRESLGIEDAMLREDERLMAAAQAGPAGLETALHASYKRRGQYVEQVSRYRQAFPEEQLFILGSAEVFSNPGAALGEVSSYLGIAPPPGSIDFAPRNQGGNRTEVPAIVRDHLSEHFAPYNDRLWELLGRRIDW